MQTGDTEAWATMSADVCGFCARISEDAAAITQNGESYTGGVITLSEVRVLARDDLIGGFPVDARFVQSPVRHTAADGTVINETVGDSGVVRIDTLHLGDGWKILAVVVKDA